MGDFAFRPRPLSEILNRKNLSFTHGDGYITRFSDNANPSSNDLFVSTSSSIFPIGLSRRAYSAACVHPSPNPIDVLPHSMRCTVSTQVKRTDQTSVYPVNNSHTELSALPEIYRNDALAGSECSISSSTSESNCSSSTYLTERFCRMLRSNQSDDARSILSTLHERTFYGREWVFEKILKLLHSYGEQITSETCSTCNNNDTISDGKSECTGLAFEYVHSNFASNSSLKIAIIGGPGSGKTTLCRRIMRSHESSHAEGELSGRLSSAVSIRSRILAAHFCCAQIPESFDPSHFVISVHRQVSSHSLPLSTSYMQLLQMNGSPFGSQLQMGTLNDTPDQAFRLGVLAALSSLSNTSLNRNCYQSNTASFEKRDVFILLVDALDESEAVLRSCESGASHDGKSRSILELLVNHVQFFPDWLCLLITCRRQHRNAIFRRFPGMLPITIDDLHRSAVSHDVHQYILSRLTAEPQLHLAFRDHMHSDTFGLLRIKSCACYLYLETCLDAISEAWINPEQLLSIPGTLNGLYLWLCQSIFGASETQSGIFNLVRPIFEIVSASRQTLTELELYRILSFIDPSVSLSAFRYRLKLVRKFFVVLTTHQERVLYHNFLNGPVESEKDEVDTYKIHYIHSSFAEWLTDVKHCTQLYLCDVEHGAQLIEQSLHQRREIISQTVDSDRRDEQQYIPSSSELDCTELSEATNDPVESPLQDKTDPLDSSSCCYTNQSDGTLQPLPSFADLRHVTSMLINPVGIVMASRKGDLRAVRQLLEHGTNVNQLDGDGWSALRTAAWCGHSDIVSILLEHGADVNLTGPDGRSALRAAAWAGHEHILKMLLDAGASVDIRDAEGRSPIIAAAYMGHVGVVELLAQAGADLNHADEDGRTALHVAAFCIRPSDTHHNAVACLLECGANPNVVDSEGITPLLGAARVGNSAVCELCLEADCDVNQLDKHGNTAVTLAILGGHNLVVKSLLFWGAAVDTMDSGGRSLLSLAAAIGNSVIVQELLARGLDEAHRDHLGCTPLHLAAAGPYSAAAIDCEPVANTKQYCEVIRILLDSGSHLTDTDSAGRTPLLVACEHSQVESVRVLLTHSPSSSTVCSGSNDFNLIGSHNPSDVNGPQLHLSHRSLDGYFPVAVNQPSLDHQTPLRVASLANNAELVQLLLSAGADPDYQDEFGRTTLYLLALDNLLDMADLLLHTPVPGARSRRGSGAVLGANPVIADDEGRCPLHVATWQGHLAMVKMLLQAGTPADIRDRDGRTPLQLASWQGHAAVCQYLIKEGNARVDAVCSQGATSLSIAAQEGHLDVCSILLQEGANPFQPDAHGRTPYRVALKAGHLEICKLLDLGFKVSPLVALPSHSAPFPVVSGSSRLSSCPPEYPRISPRRSDLHASDSPRKGTPSSDSSNFPNHCPSVRTDFQTDRSTVQDLLDDADPYAKPQGPFSMLSQLQPAQRFIEVSQGHNQSSLFASGWPPNKPLYKQHGTALVVHPQYPVLRQIVPRSQRDLISTPAMVGSPSPLNKCRQPLLHDLPHVSAEAQLDNSQLQSSQGTPLSPRSAPQKCKKYRDFPVDQMDRHHVYVPEPRGLSINSSTNRNQEVAPTDIQASSKILKYPQVLAPFTNIGFYPDVLPLRQNVQVAQDQFRGSIMDSYGKSSQSYVMNLHMAVTNPVIVSPSKRKERAKNTTDKSKSSCIPRDSLKLLEPSPRSEICGDVSRPSLVETKGSSARSTLANMFGFGSRRIKKCNKVNQTSYFREPICNSDFKTSLTPRMDSPQLCNIHIPAQASPIDHKAQVMSNRKTLPSGSSAEVPVLHSSGRTVLSKLKDKSVPDNIEIEKCPSSSMPLESFARRLACCSQVDVLARNPEYVDDMDSAYNRSLFSESVDYHQNISLNSARIHSKIS